MKAIIALVTRCPGLSDGAKVTLAELLIHYPNALPSLKKLAALRGVWKSTIQLHMKELERAEILRVSVTAEGRRVFIDEDVLAKKCGFKNAASVKSDWVTNKDAGFTLQCNVQVLNKPLKEYHAADWLMYFELAGKRNKAVIEHENGDREKMRVLKMRYGGKNLKRMIDHFSAYHRQMNEEYTVQAMARRSRLLIERVV